MTTLAQLQASDRAVIEAFTGEDELTQRLLVMGMVQGEVVEFIRKAPLGDPLIFRIGGTRLSLRRAEAASVQVSILEAALAG